MTDPDFRGSAARAGGERGPTASSPPTTPARGGTVRVRVRFFARYRELAGTQERTLELPPGTTVRELVDGLRASGGLSALPAEPAVAVNLEYADSTRRLADGDEVALIPPVAGGNRARVRTAISDGPLDPAGLMAGLGSEADGAVVLFVGRVRDRNEGRPVTALEYEAYREMAERELEAIAREASERHGAAAVSAVHRVGRLEPGEPSVAVAVAAAHRAQAYATSRAVMEAIKARLPVWKRELYADGTESWVAPAGHAGAAGEREPSIAGERET